nr:Asparagine synthase domain containing protein [Haemonchus contortus]
MSVLSPPDVRKLVEALLSDLRQLSTEAKKKHNHVKEAAESGVVRVRNISTASGEATLLTNLRAASNELLHPLILACATRQTRLVQIALQSIQRLVQHRILEASCANVVVSELWGLVEVECEELRVLQTVPPLVSADLLVTGNTLAKCIVMCFRMHFAKDPVVINAASAAVRQLVGCVLERVIQEDGVFSTELTVVPSSGGRPSPRSAPPTLRPCAADAYLLFKDLCLLINAKPSVWLVGIHEMTRTLGLELIENILKSYPGVFFRHPEFCDLLKSEVCPLVIKLFSPSLKSAHVSSQHPLSRSSAGMGPPADRPYFPIAMRLVRIILCLISLYHQLLPTECEIFLSSLIKFVDVDRRGWQRALSLEALHRVVARPDIVRWLCENFDARSNSTKVLEHLSHSIFCVIQQSFVPSKMSSVEADIDTDILQPRGSSGFYFCNVWHPFVEHLSAKKSILLDSLERHEAGVLPEGYVVSRAHCALVDFVQAVYAAVDALSLQENGDKNNNEHVADSIFTSCQPNLLTALSLLLSASADETVTDQLLCALSTLMSVGCKLKAISASLNCLYVLCCACLPSVTYLRSYAGAEIPSNDEKLEELVFDSSSALHEVVVSGTPCPSSVVVPDKWNDQVMLTSRNLQAASILLSSICAHATYLDELWHLSLLTCQHIAWLLGIRPSSTGIFAREKAEVEQQNNANVITTAALTKTPVLAALLDKVACSSVSLSDASFLKAIEAMMRISDENVAVAATGRECSLFPLAMLLRFASLNLHRQQVFWDRVTAHFIKVCGHVSPSLREWAAVALSSIIKQAFKAKTDLSEAEHQSITLKTLRSMCSIHQADVQRRQLDCLMALLQTDGAQLVPEMWHHVIFIVAAVVDEENCCDEALVRQGYLGLRLVAADFLQSLPFECISVLVEAVARYGKQTADHNISLSALTQLWTISDFVFRKSEVVGADASEKVWLVLYTCLSELCVDVRPSVRKSACQTLLQTVASHGHALRISTWNHMIWQIIMPLLDRVRVQTRSASTERASGALLMHHSRDTQQKQWTETCIHTLSAAAKIFVAQRKALLALEDFGSAWEALLSYLEWASCYHNAELSLSALKSFQEVLLGKISSQTLDINYKERASSVESSTEDVTPYLPLPQWIESWNAWQRISRGLARMGTSATTTENGEKSSYVPGPSHLTTLLHIFPPLFEHVARHISVDELKAEQLPSVLESLVNVPVPTEQVPFVVHSSQSHMSPTQEAVLEAIRSIYNECTSQGSALRDALADQIRQLLRFGAMSVKSPVGHRPITTLSGQKDYREWALQWVIPFAETSLRMAVEFFTATVAYPEIIRSLVVVDIVKFLGEPLYMKYSCLSPTTWKLAASSLMTVLRIAVPLGRQQVEHFAPLWPAICDTLEKFLFTPNVCPRLAADERKRDELAECQVVELVRSELLLHSACLPPATVQRLIAILNRGSISQLDPTDVLASDSHAQRVELARTCFDALLSTSNEGNGRLGNVAIASLLQRCSQVMNDFVRDWNGIGDLRLPRGRIAEITSALQAVDSLIGRLAREPSQSELYAQLVSLYPSVVDVVEATELDELQDDEELVMVLLSRSGPWSVIYYRPDLNRLFVCRDVFGRLSLVCAADADDLVLSDIVHNHPNVCWNEVPYAQVCCINTETRCAVSTSYLPSYPENILEPWSSLFSSFTLRYSPCKDILLRVSRTTFDSFPKVQEEFFEGLVKATRSMVPHSANSAAVAFSGGIDSLLVAISLHEAFPFERSIDLVNVAFLRGSQHRSIVTDRQRAITGLQFLRSKFPCRRWRLVLVDVTLEELEANRSKHIVKAAAPALSVLDESLACVLWFALRGVGEDYDNGDEVRSDAEVYFVGSGADELFAGYARHRTRFERDGAESIPEECEAELSRLGCRNGGRDARVAVVLNKELRAPFLHDDFVAWVNTLPAHLKWDLALPRGVGEKMIIRQVLASFGAPHDAPKQAMQFGSGFVKMQNNKMLKGSDVSHHLLAPLSDDL